MITKELLAGRNMWPIPELIDYFADNDYSPDKRWKKARKAMQVVWACYEDCALSPNPVWSLKKRKEYK